MPDTALETTPADSFAPAQLRRAMNVNIVAGCLGNAWAIVFFPANILTVFIMNELGASAGEFGVLTALLQLVAVLHLVAIVIFSRLETRKPFWLWTTVIHRLMGLCLAGAAFYAAQGGNKPLCIWLTVVALTVSFALTTLSASGWWSWMADLVPAGIRATFFGRRSAIVLATGMVWLFSLTVLLDYLKPYYNILYVYAALFAGTTVLGVLDILLFILIPEPRRRASEPRAQLTVAEFLAPVRDANFRTLCLAVGLYSMSVNVAAPFFPAYITDAKGLNAPLTWLGVINAITLIVWVFTARWWGVIMDRYGRKPAVIIGALFPFVWLGYLFMTPQNYPFILPLLALVAGVIVSGWGDGVSQLMLTLTPEKNRTAYVAWYFALTGVITSAGPLVGGLLYNGLKDLSFRPFGHFTLNGFQMLVVIALLLVSLSLYILSFIREGKTRSVSWVLSRLATPTILRTFINMNTLSKTGDSSEVARALRQLDEPSDELAVTDVVNRLDDPDAEVRLEAVRALGRIKSAEAVHALLTRLGDPTSPVRMEAARALGHIRDRQAVPFLISALENSQSEEFEEACVQALGEIGGQESAQRLTQLFRETHAERVLVTGAEAVSRLGLLEAAWEVLPRMHDTNNPVLRKQLAIAMGNMLGNPGEFYRYITGDAEQQAARQEKLFAAAAANLEQLCNKLPETDRARLWSELREEFRLVCINIEGGTLMQALTMEQHILRRLAGYHCPKADASDEILMEYTFATDVKLGLGLWFVQEVITRVKAGSNADLQKLDALLGAYFLSRYRAEEPEP